MSEKSKSEGSSPLPTSSPAPQPTSSPLTSTSEMAGQPLNDFMGVLKMKRSSDESHDSSKGVKESNGATKKSGRERVNEDKEEKMETESATAPEETLVDLFRRDPSAVLKLLESALSMDKLNSLLADEHKQNNVKLYELRSQLEAAYHTLKDCSEQKVMLSGRIEKTNEKVKAKRKELESLREELRVLGEEELKLKRKRDSSYTSCADVKKKLKCSRDALQQLAVLAPSKNNKGPTSMEGGQNT